MTCIVGIEFDDRVILGGDIQGTGGNHKIVHTQPKVFSKKGVVFGYTSSYRFGQILEHGLPDPVVPKDTDEIYRWIIAVLVPDIKHALRDSGYDGGGNCLIGVRSQLWEMQTDFSVLRSTRGYNAVGSGSEYALGSITTSIAFGITTKKDYISAVRQAISVAGTFSPSVGEDSTIITT